MDRAARIAIAKRVLDMIDKDEVDYSDESWEADIGRFVDKERFELEKQKFFLERPQLIAYSADIPNPGDYYATEIVGRPILLTRGKDGKARAFLNACRHRGVKLAEGCGHAAGFTCPYHGWTFGIDGTLLSVPSRMAFEESQLKNRNLIELPLAEEIGLILVHPQPDGHVDFDEFMGPMKAHLAGYHFENLRLVHEYRAPARINWKHAVDGGVEGYHVPYLHPQTVGPMTLKQFLNLDFGMHQGLVSVSPDIVKLKDLPESEWPEYCHFSVSNAIFPNTVVGAGELMAFFQRSEPGDEPGTCNYIFRTYGWDRNAPAEIHARDKGMAEMLLQVALEEDMKTQISSQIMMEAGAVPSVVFGKREQNIMRMHKNYDRLIGHDAAAALRTRKTEKEAA
jgi:phenylpropionate dioxygenase-like ring-hydroxylating dioxygenase large terminal subunit